jgi:hypothetical protein
LKLMTKSTCKYRWSAVWSVGAFLTFCSRPFFERRMGQEIEGDVLGENYKGYIFKLAGGNDKDGFPMKQGVMINGRTRMMFKTGRKFSQSAYLLILIDNRCHHLHPQKNR